MTTRRRHPLAALWLELARKYDDAASVAERESFGKSLWEATRDIEAQEMRVYAQHLRACAEQLNTWNGGKEEEGGDQ